MSLTRSPRVCIKVAGVLSEATPTFVSLVRNGANQTPFKVIKSDSPMTLTKTTKGIALETGVEINRIVFKSENFADDVAVAKFMDENGFSGYSIEKAEDEKTFTVKGIDEGSFESISLVELEGGVSLYGGKLKAEVAKALEKKTDEPVKELWKTTKGESVIKKFDWYLARISDGKTVTEVMKDACADGIPIGFSEATSSFQTALSNVIKSGDPQQIAAISREYGDYLTKLASFVETNITSKAEGMEDLLKKMTEGAAEPDAPAPEPTPTPTPEPGNEPPAPAPVAEVPAETVSKADYDAAILRLKALEDKLETLATKSELDAVAKTANEVKETVSKAENRLASVESLKQTRKSSDDPAVTPPPTGDATKKDADGKPLMSKAEMNLLGLRPE